jgi:hypothetical protein
MDTMKLLLGATVALLLGALAMSWQGLKQGEKNTPPEEIARIQREVAEMKLEHERLKLEVERQHLRNGATTVQAAPVPATPVAAPEALEAQLAAKEAELAKIQKDKAKAERDMKTYRDEAGIIAQRDLEKNDAELKRGRLIAQALLVGRIHEYVEDPKTGGIAVIEIATPQHVEVKTGTVLAIRRNNGLLGQLKVTSVEPEGAIASPVTAFGTVKPQPGDELIIPPQY